MSDTAPYIGCPVQHARRFIAGKWQMGILWSLKDGPLRFNEVRALLPGISDKALVQELAFFVEQGIVERRSRAFPTARVEYALAAPGRRLVPILTAIVEWGYLHLQDERASRELGLTPLSVIRGIEDGLAERA